MAGYSAAILFAGEPQINYHHMVLLRKHDILRFDVPVLYAYDISLSPVVSSTCACDLMRRLAGKPIAEVPSHHFFANLGVERRASSVLHCNTAAFISATAFMLLQIMAAKNISMI
jgi:hypothetical protein